MQLAAIEGRAVAPNHADVVDLERRLLAVKAGAAHTELRRALTTARRRDAAAAWRLRRAARRELGKLRHILPDAGPLAPAGGPANSVSGEAAPARRPVRAMAATVAAAAVLPLVGTLILLVWNPAPRTPQPPAGLAGQTPEGEVAGGTPPSVQSTPSPSPERELDLVADTFDEGLVHARPGAWSLQGEGEFAIAPFPNAVDRSMLLTTGEAPGSVMACREAPSSARSLTVDLYATTYRDTSVMLTLGGDQVTVAIEDDGTALLQAGGVDVPIGASLSDGVWHTVSLTVSLEERAAEAHLAPSESATATSASVALPATWPRSVDAVSVCVGSGSGSHAALYVNNLVLDSQLTSAGSGQGG